eukprot:15464455-Alexandrium_andersonii.AAC.1
MSPAVGGNDHRPAMARGVFQPCDMQLGGSSSGRRQEASTTAHELWQLRAQLRPTLSWAGASRCSTQCKSTAAL